MANGVVSRGYEGGITIGQRKFVAFTWAGPASYVQATGDPMSLTQMPYLDFVTGSSLSVSGNYCVEFKPSSAGPRATWNAFYYNQSGQTPVSNATNLSAETFSGIAFGGDF